MGRNDDPDAAADPYLTVREAQQVIDASVMPRLVTDNAPTMAIADRAALLMLG